MEDKQEKVSMGRQRGHVCPPAFTQDTSCASRKISRWTHVSETRARLHVYNVLKYTIT